jgi:ribose transport system ATP-binding protein
MFGLHPGRSSGELFLFGHRVVIASPADAIRHGLALAPEDRKREGIILEMTVAANTSLASLHRIERFGVLINRAEHELVTQALERFRVKTPSIQQLIRNLSGAINKKSFWPSGSPPNPSCYCSMNQPAASMSTRRKTSIP